MVYGPRQRPRSGEIIDGIIAALTVDLQGSAIYNLGNSRPLLLREMIDALEIALHRTARISLQSERSGDVAQTFADIERARAHLFYNPKVSFADGLQRFAVWLHGRENPISSAPLLAEIR